jgi:hypothetical protein
MTPAPALPTTHENDGGNERNDPAAAIRANCATVSLGVFLPGKME